MGNEHFKKLICPECGKVVKGNSENFITAGFNKHMAWHKRQKEKSGVVEQPFSKRLTKTEKGAKI
jgi:hypothetical protein